MVLLEGVFKDSLILELGGAVWLRNKVWSFSLLKKKHAKEHLNRKLQNPNKTIEYFIISQVILKVPLQWGGIYVVCFSQLCFFTIESKQH